MERTYHPYDVRMYVILAIQIRVARQYANAGISVGMRPANEIRRYNVTTSLTGWAHTQTDPYEWRCVYNKFRNPVSMEINCSSRGPYTHSPFYWYESTLIPAITYPFRKSIVHPLKVGNISISSPPLYWGCDYSSLLGSKLLHVTERRPRDLATFRDLANPLHPPHAQCMS